MPKTGGGIVPEFSEPDALPTPGTVEHDRLIAELLEPTQPGFTWRRSETADEITAECDLCGEYAGKVKPGPWGGFRPVGPDGNAKAWFVPTVPYAVRQSRQLVETEHRRECSG